MKSADEQKNFSKARAMPQDFSIREKIINSFLQREKNWMV